MQLEQEMRGPWTRRIPHAWLWVMGGAVYGVAMRLLFGWLPASSHGAMSAGFLVATPIAIGALAVYLGRERARSWAFCLGAPAVSVLLTLLGCAITLLEGSICLFMMAPLFLLGAIVGGVLMGLALRVFRRQPQGLQAVAVLPLLVLAFEPATQLQEHARVVERSVVIAAPRSEVWQQIVQARAIEAEELPFSWVHWIGVPRPLEGVNVVGADGEVRYSLWERGVKFRGEVSERVEPDTLRWHYRFDADSFPPGSMDEHVEIGGRYFKLDDTRFDLRELDHGRTELRITAHYRVASSINFYALPLAEFLGRDFVDMLLGFYKGRSERAVGLVLHRDASGAMLATAAKAIPDSRGTP